jgi:enoyl-CoA hydratase/carnithine racemase
MTGPIAIDVEDYVATVVMNRPPVNAQNVEFREALIAAFDEISDRDDVRVAILTGAGKVFSAGADLKDRGGLEKPGEYWRHSRRVREAFNAVAECAKPVIAAVNGPALGAGFVLMASCDIMIASETAVFAMPEIDVGLAGGAAMLRTLFGKSVARELFFTGKRVSASELHRLGVISECIPPDQLMTRGREIAAQIAAKSPIGVVYSKHAFNTVDNMPGRDGYRFEQNITHQLSKTGDAKEAKLAFLERRAPVFQGR